MKMDDKSKYWKTQTQHYDLDEEGNVILHEDAPEEVKKSYKQYQIEQSMMSFFVEEEEEEIPVERTYNLNEEQEEMLTTFLESKKKENKVLKKDYSMYRWQQHHEYYDMKEGKVIFHEDTPQDILESYHAYAAQQKKLLDMKHPKGFSFKKFIEIMASGKGK